MSPSSPASDEARRVLIAANPKAGARPGGERVEELKRWLNDSGYPTEVSTEIDKTTEIARRWRDSGDLRAVVSAGGDGTINFLANRLPRETPLAVLPLGTENLLAQHLELPLEAEGIGRIIRAGATIPMDAGRAGDRLFLNMLGCGFDAEVVRQTHASRRGNIWRLSYLKPILNSIRSYPYPELRIYCDPSSPEAPSQEDPAIEIRAKWAFVVNLPRYAGGLSFAPDARGDDGLLDVCTFKRGSLWTALGYLWGVVRRQHPDWDDCVIRRARRLRIESDEEVPYQLDGDPGGFLPVDIEVLPGRVQLLVSSDWAERNRRVQDASHE